MYIEYKHFRENTAFHGRNGTGKCRGLNLFLSVYEAGPQQITIQPVTSKGCGANCCIDIPEGDVDKVISALVKLLDPSPALCQMRKALGHALQRLNEIPHSYSGTNFALIENALLDIVLMIGPDEFTPSFILSKAKDIEDNTGDNDHA